MIIISNSDFKLETTTIWSFPNRGNWAAHSGKYRGNWSPYIPRNLMLRYTKENEWVLDTFVGGGTTAIEAALLNRNFIGIDINPEAIDITNRNLKNINIKSKCIVQLGDATRLSDIEDNSIDLICMHPPYCNIIKYSQDIKGDLSLVDEPEFYEKMSQVADEGWRVLKKGKHLAILIGDMRRKGNIIPLGFNVMEIFTNKGFTLKEIIIKEQHNCRKTEKWQSIKNRKFLLIKHEYLFIYNK